MVRTSLLSGLGMNEVARTMNRMSERKASQMVKNASLGVLALLLAAGFAQAGAQSATDAAETVDIGRCLAAASAVKAGDYVKVEFLSVSPRGVPTYEIEVRGNDGREWELMCDALSGTIYEIEQEARSAAEPLFQEQASVSEAEARAKALSLYPGTIEEVEYELESNGDASYEIDLVNGDGTEFKIEVDAGSGEIIEVSVEAWEIGQEAGERS